MTTLGSRALPAIVLTALLVGSAPRAQVRQTHLYLDDGNGNMTILSAGSGGGNITFPSGDGTLLTSGANGTLSILNGGTGASTAADAANNLLPAQATHQNQFLMTDGSGTLSWAAAGLSVAGTTGQTLYNDGSGWVATSSLFNDAPNGHLGIGTTTPNYPLDIKTATGGYGLNHSDGTVVMSTYVGNGGPYGGAIGTQTNHPFFIYTNNGGAKLTVMPSGNVGIGQTNPTTARLEILEPTGYYSSYSTNTYSGIQDHYALYGKSVNNPGYGYGLYAEGGFYGVYGAGNGSSYTGGVTGVYGSASGTAGTRYGVYGAASGGTTNYGVYCSGNGGYTGTWLAVSDRKLKENIAPLTGALAKVMQLRPVTYTFKTSPEFGSMNLPTGTQIGLISQDVQAVIPELVSDGVNPGNLDPATGRRAADISFKGLNYIGLTPILAEAIQEQQRIIDSLRSAPSPSSMASGNVVTDATGFATVVLPYGFENADGDLSYQLTIVGTEFAQAIVYSKVVNNQFVIRTDRPGVEVSWQISIPSSPKGSATPGR